jgi:hypothetical protein
MGAMTPKGNFTGMINRDAGKEFFDLAYNLPKTVSRC